MTFDTQQLFDTHKRKFCVGSTVDPARIHSRISGKSGPRNERKDKDGSQTVSKTAEIIHVRTGQSLCSSHCSCICTPKSREEGWKYFFAS